jgi:uncharacterized protein (TIRG00374 family)
LVIRANINKVGNLVGSVNPLILVLVLLFDVVNIIFYGTAWYFLVHTLHPKVPLAKCVQGVMISIFGDILVPTASVTGEALRVNFANREFGLPYPEGIATILVHRVLNGLASGTILAIGAAVLVLGGELSARLRLYILILLILVMIPSLLGITMLFRPGIGSRIVLRLMGGFANRQLTAGLVHRITGGVLGFETSMKLIRARGRNILFSFLFLGFQWFFQVLIPYAFLIAISSALQQPINYWTFFWLISVAFPIFGLVNLIPIGIPGMVGILDSAMAGTFILLGITPEVAIATTLLTRIVIVVFELSVCGAVVALSGYQSLIKTRKTASHV